jgi:hypothetical protein
LRRAEGIQGHAQLDILVGENRGREQGGILGAGRPMAKVATGMPLGIWAMDSSESMPFNALDCTGTPSTGTDVLAAVIPGR